MADVRVNDLPHFSNFGDLSPDDLLVVYMSSVDKTAKATLGEAMEQIGAAATSQLSTPNINLTVIGDNEIDLDWAAVANATTYKLYRSETTFAEADLIYTGSALIFEDTGLIAGTTYKYWLQATASGYKDSGYSQGTATTTGAGADVTPPVLSSLEVSTVNPNQIILTYNETLQTVGSATTTQWKIPGKTCTFATISGSTVTLTFNANFVPGETPLLSYTGNQVKDLAGNLAATFSNQAVTNALVITAVKLGTPQLSAVASSATQINLTWTNVANESNFQIQKSPDGAAWSNHIAPSADVLAYNDTGLVASTLYYYRIKAVGDGVNFSDSDWSIATAQTQASVPSTWDSAIHLTGFMGEHHSAAGITATKLVWSPNNHIYFNAISPLSQLGKGMIIRFGGTNNMYVNFPGDYSGKPFLYERAGIQYLSTFPNDTGTYIDF